MLDLKKLDMAVRGLKSIGTRFERHFGSGLSVVVSASTGLKTWYFTQRVAGRAVRTKLGVYPHTTARDACDAMVLERSRVKSAPVPELAELQRKVASNIPQTLAELIERYRTEYLQSSNVGEDWRRAAEGYLDRDVVPVIGKYPLKSLSRDVLLHAVDEKVKTLTAAGRRGTAANNLLATLTGMLRWAAERGWVADGLLAGVRKPVKPRAKQRVLSRKEVGELWNMLEACKLMPRGPANPVFATVLQVLMLTGARISEIVGPAETERTGLTPRDVDLRAGTITLDDGKTDASARVLPMPPTLRRLVEQGVAQAGDPSQPVWRYTGEEVIPGYKGENNRIKQGAITRCAVRVRSALKHEPPWTAHDLRRTVVTTLAKLGVNGDIRRMISGHKGGMDVHDVHYNHAQQRDEVLAALTKLERFIFDAADEVRRGSVVDR